MTRRFSLSIFDYDEISDFLNATFDQIKKNHPAYSIRAWAQRLKAGHPSSLTKIMAGHKARRIPEDLVANICIALDLDPQERAYFELLAMAKGRISPQSFELISALIKGAAQKSSSDS